MLKDTRLSDTSVHFRDVTRSSETIRQSSVSKGSHQNFGNYALAIKMEPRRAESPSDAKFPEPALRDESSISAQPQNHRSTQEEIRTDASTDQAEANSYDSSSEWANADAIPGNREGKKVYRDAQVQTPSADSIIWGQRFDYMFTKLEAAVNSYQHLRDDMKLCGSIGYSQHMVGTTPETARPSIVVLCRKEYLNALRSIFLRRFKEQLNFGGRKYLRLLRLQAPDQNSDELFDIVFFCKEDDPIVRKASEDTLEAYFDTKATWCGGLAMSGSRSSTLGLAIYNPDFLGVLTVDHLFYPPITSSCTQNPTSTGLPQGIPDTSKQELDIMEQRDMERWLEAADEYDFSDTDSQSDPPNAEKVETHTMQPDPNSDLIITSRNTMEDRTRWHRVMPRIPFDDKMPYMDWALVRPGLDNETQSLPNIFFPNGPSESSVALGKVFVGSPTHWAGVFMISGVRGILKGHLLASHSRLGSSLGSHASEAWTVILDSDTSGIVDGECGSLIIDQTSSEVYGHVVACGPLGQVYVSPMKHVMNQIKSCFEFSEASAVSDHAFGTYRSAVPASVRNRPEPDYGQGPSSNPDSPRSYYTSTSSRSSRSSYSSRDPYYTRNSVSYSTTSSYPKLPKNFVSKGSGNQQSGVTIHNENARGYSSTDPHPSYASYRSDPSRR